MQHKTGRFLLLTGIFWFSLYTYVSGLPNYASEVLGAGEVMLGSIIGAYGLTQMLLRIPLGIVSDTLRRRKLFIQIGFVISGLAALGMALSRSPASLMVFRGMSGMAAATWVTFTVLYSSYFQEQSTARAMGMISAAMGTGQMLGMLSGGFLSGALFPSAPFFLALAGAGLGFFLSFGICENPPTTPPQKLSVLLMAGLNKRMLSASLLSILVQLISYATIFGFTARWARQVIGMQDWAVGLLTTMQTLGSILSSRFLGVHIAQRISERYTTSLGFLLVALSVGLIPFAQGPIQMLCLQALCGVGFGLQGPMLLSEAIRDAKPELRGAAMGFYQSLYGIGMFAGPVLAGRIVAAAGMAANFGIMAGVAVFAALSAAVLLKPRADKSK